ncbi:MAG: phytanoyl-CoA dioxygenase family protein [Gammaproteobacteria bacterium]|nr:phytanoyl-CoA dioxygenase family protein [Gammaproteobacteria bacterium]
MGTTNFLESINGEEGYTTQLKLNNEDLNVLRKFIRIQWLYRLQLLLPRHVQEFDRLGMERYHEVSDLIEHKMAWPKEARVLPREAVEVIRSLDFFKRLEASVGKFQISDEEHLGWEEIYWRIVRPGDSDVGSLHADKWFWDIGAYGKVADFPHERIKIWIPIYSVPGKNGLLVSPGSHLREDWRWHAEKKFGLNKPVLDEPIENIDPILLPLNAGEAVIFHDKLLHGGSPNLVQFTRVSLEFTLLIPMRVDKEVALSSNVLVN